MINYQLLGKTGLRVADLCLGTMTFGDEWGWGATKDEARKIYDYYREQGGNFIDTANIYTNGTSETFVGEFITGHRSEVVLATKYNFLRTIPPPAPCFPRPFINSSAARSRVDGASRRWKRTVATNSVSLPDPCGGRRLESLKLHPEKAKTNPSSSVRRPGRRKNEVLRWLVEGMRNCFKHPAILPPAAAPW